MNSFTEKAYDIEEIRKKHKSAYAPWNDELDRELKFMFEEGLSTKDLANHFGRTKGAIRARIQKLYSFGRFMIPNVFCNVATGHALSLHYKNLF